MFDQFLFLIILLLLSAFFSSTELAFVVSNKLKIEIKARSKNLPALTAQFFNKNPQEFFSTILISNNIVNIAFASLSAVFLTSNFAFSELEVLLISTLTLLLFGELIPKYFARELADRMVLIVSIPLRITSFILYPFIKLTALLTGFSARNRKTQVDNLAFLFDKDDIKSLVHESHKAGNVKEREGDIISRVFELGDQKVYEAMRPRTETVGVEISSSIEDVIELFIESGYSKLPVYDDNLDNIKGVLLAKDLFRNPKNISEIIRSVPFYPETKKSLEILNEFLDKNISIAVIVDEFGGTAGIITIEDIIEELFGEIKDEYDVDENICRKISENEYIISGKVEIDLINEKYSLGLPTGNYETLAGFIIQQTGKIPKQGEAYFLENFQILIIRAEKVRIDLIKLTIRNSE